MTDRRTNLMSAPIDCVTIAEAADLCASWAAERGRTRNIVSLNAKTVVTMANDPALREAVEGAALVVADGVSISLAARILAVPLRGRVPGIDLMAKLLESARERGLTCYFLGARPEVIDSLLSTLPIRYPGLRIAGAHHGYFDRLETADIVRRVRDATPHILFVALGQPEAEVFCHRHGGDMGAPLTMSVGGSFDVMSGTIRRSPRWMQKMGVEWLWRFLLEPRKRFRVIFVDNVAFLGLVIRNFLSDRLARRG